MPSRDQRVEERPHELAVSLPDRIARLAPLKRADVDKDRARAFEQDIIGRRVLESPAFVQEARRQGERQLAGGVQHLGWPLVRVRREPDLGMFNGEPARGPSLDDAARKGLKGFGF